MMQRLRTPPPPARVLNGVLLQFLLAGVAVGLGWGAFTTAPALAFVSLLIGFGAVMMAYPGFKRVRAALAKKE